MLDFQNLTKKKQSTSFFLDTQQAQNNRFKYKLFFKVVIFTGFKDNPAIETF